MADSRYDTLIAFSVFTHYGWQRVGVADYRIHKTGMQCFVDRIRCTGNNKHRAGAVVGIAVAALAQFDEGLVVCRQLWQFYALQNQCAAGIVERCVERYVGEGGFLFAPANLLVLKYVGGYDHPLALDVAYLTACFADAAWLQ